MKVGLILPNILSPVNDAETLVTAAKMAEDAGFDSIWAADHVLMPAQHRQYGNGLEILMTLAYLAAQTRRIELGTAILLLPMRNPLLVARQFATLDVLSGGRTIFGVGVGWNADEFGFMNADFSRRGALVDEYIDIVYKLWTDDRPAHEGSYRFSDVIAEPRPTRLPLLYIGGSSDAAIRRAATRGDGWLPNGPKPDLDIHVARLRELADGRDVTIGMTMRLDMRNGAQDALDTIKAQIAMGLQHVAIRFIHETRDELYAQIERFTLDVLPVLQAHQG